MGPFKVVAPMGSIAYRLELVGRLRHMHPVFHVSQLRKYMGSESGSLPPPIVVEGDDEFEIEAIVGHSVTRAGIKFVVRWKGYGEEEDSLLGEDDFGNARDLLDAYK